jgi:hypothetical protein
MRDLFPAMDFSPLYLISMVILGVFFALIAYWVYRKDRPKLYRELAELPRINDSEGWRLK